MRNPLARDSTGEYATHIIGHNMGDNMRTVSLAEAKAHLSELPDTVEAGEEIIITRHGRVRIMRLSNFTGHVQKTRHEPTSHERI